MLAFFSVKYYPNSIVLSKIKLQSMNAMKKDSTSDNEMANILAFLKVCGFYTDLIFGILVVSKLFPPSIIVSP